MNGAPEPGSVAVATRRPHVARWAALSVLVVATALVAVLATRPQATATEVQTPLLGRPAPTLAGATLEGGHFDLASLRGRWAVVNFFASWCPPCQQEEPELVTFAFEHRAAGDAALVSVVFDDAAGPARTFLEQSGATWPAVRDPGGQIALDYGVRGPPETFIVAPSGKVVVHLDGALTASGLDHYLHEAAAELG